MKTNSTIMAIVMAGIMISLPQINRAETELTAIIDIKSLDSLFDDAANITTALEQPAARDQLAATLAGVLGIQDLAPIDQTRLVRAFILTPAINTLEAGEEPSGVLVLPVVGAGEPLIAALSKTFSTMTRGDGGLYQFSNRLFQAPGQPATIGVILQDDLAYFGESAGDVRRMHQAMLNDRFKSAIPSVPGTLRVGLNMDVLGHRIAGAFNQMGDVMKASQAAGSPTGMMNTGEVLEKEGDALLAVLRGIDDLSISLSAHEAWLTLFTRMTPVADSKLADIIDKTRPPSATYANLFTGDTVAAVAASGIDAFDIILDPYMDFLDTLYAAMGPGMEGMSEAMRAMMNDMLNLYSGDFMLALIPGADGTGASLVEVFAVNDAEATTRFIEKAFATYNDLYGKMMPGMQLKELPQREYEGVTIHAYGYDINAEAMEANPAMMAAMPGMNVLKNFKWEVAVAGKNLIYVLGQPGAMDATIDRLKTGGTPITELEPFATLIPNPQGEPVDYFSMGIMSTIKSCLSAVPGMDAATLAQLPDSTGGLAGYSVRRGETLLNLSRLSYDELNLLKTSGETLGTVMMQAMMKGMTATPGGNDAMSPEAMRARCVNNLRLIDAAKEQLALEENIAEGTALSSPMVLMPYMIGGAVPTCPMGGTYTFGSIGEDPACSIDGHIMP